MNTDMLTGTVALTPKEDKQGVRIKLKVFWKTTKFWSSADIVDFQKNVPAIAERLRTEQYWNKDGDIRSNKFTCEDFAIRVLCEYASSKELPVKLTTGVRTYRNMEMYSADVHDRYASNKYGFSEMVMLTYGAPDMQRVGVNTVSVAMPDELLPGDILAQTKDNHGVAHHIQMIYSVTENQINIYQGNSGVGNWSSKLYRMLTFNPADPKDVSYTGLPIENGYYKKTSSSEWNYINKTANSKKKDFLKLFEFYKWHFQEFNR